MKNVLWGPFVAFVFYVFAGSSAYAITDLTGSVWDVTGDDGIWTWEGSTLEFTSQVSSGENYEIDGYFDWVGSGGQSGREIFSGTCFSDNTLLFSGMSLIDPVSIVLANYAAAVLPDGNKIVGDWDSGVVPDSGVPGDWEAVRGSVEPVPLPASLPLLAFALGGLGLLAHRKKSA